MPERLAAAIVLPPNQVSNREERTMEPILISDAELVEDATEEGLIHAWRAEQLQRLGLPRLLAERFAEVVDWHEVADLIAGGCSLGLALEIAR
jgi:hypothetical protein